MLSDLSVCTSHYREVDRKGLREVQLPDQGNRPRWRGIQHGELVDTIDGVLQEEYKWAITAEKFAVSPNDAKLIGGFQLRQLKRKGPLLIEGLPHKTALCMGIRHGNDSTFALTCSMGASVLVCENGLVTGEFQAKHRHSSKFNLHGFVCELLDGYMQRVDSVQQSLAALAARQITNVDHEHGLLELARVKALPWKMLQDFDTGWYASIERRTVGEGFSGGTAWDWYNHANVHVKRTPPVTQLQRLHRAYHVASQLAIAS